MSKINPEEILQYIKKHYPDNIEENRNALNELLELLGDLAESLHESGVIVKSWEYYFETIIHKILFHSLSISELSKGIEIKSERLKVNTKVLDTPSIFILTRSIIESFLTLEYIYIEDIPEEEKFFRFKLWEMSGLLSRQNFDTEGKKELEEKKQNEKELIEKIKKEIESHPKFSALGKQQIHKINTFGLPRIKSWIDMIDSSSLNTKPFKSSYKLFSNYAHSEFLSILQIKQSNLNISNKDTQSSVNLSINTIKQIVCLTIEWLNKNYPSAQAISNNLSEDLKTSIRIWTNIAKGNNP